MLATSYRIATWRSADELCKFGGRARAHLRTQRNILSVTTLSRLNYLLARRDSDGITRESRAESLFLKNHVARSAICERIDRLSSNHSPIVYPNLTTDRRPIIAGSACITYSCRAPAMMYESNSNVGVSSAGSLRIYISPYREHFISGNLDNSYSVTRRTVIR